ncbi:hypothetical protein [Halomarina oriensis]|uniref:Uncharacterized protein n=1 Tax=Halomarina oriensis TaxID=671145 RepID=A0A6B0GP53_9EURY|nr:hypothetical protein [Halomarina oriensis]MWG36584.1 hypothetical protein [Halomarina oriensis]
MRYQQQRRLSFDGVTVEHLGRPTDDLDFEVSVSTKEEGLGFTITIYNLAEASWSTLQKKDEVQIDLGWAETGLGGVCLGRIEDSRAEPANGGADTKYVLEGVDATSEAYAFRYNRTWFDADPATIARQLNANAGGGTPAIVESVGQPLDGAWAVKDDLAVRDHLDRLTKEAEGMTGEQWEWDARGGKFYFHPTGTPGEGGYQLFSTQTEGTLQSVSRATGNSTQDGGEELSFRAYLDAAIGKHTPVSLQSQRNPGYNGEYLVSDYEFVSDTVSGDHYVEGTLTPTAATYSAPLPGNPSMKQLLLSKQDELERAADPDDRDGV